MTAAPTTTKTDRLRTALLGGGLCGCLAWAYGPTLVRLAQRWSQEPQYSHGFLVPFFAAAVLWQRWRSRPPSGARPEAWGVALFALAGLIRLAAARLFSDALDGASLPVALLGLAVVVGGRPALRWCWPAAAYLVFMLPLPFRVESALSQPLQWLAVQLSAYALQTLGYPAVAEGNLVVIGELKLFVLEACNGLGMLAAFFALAAALALLIRRPLWERLVLLVSAAPIGVLANLIRIVATSVLFVHLGEGSPAARALLHDAAGWAMMPLALALMWLESKLLANLFRAPAPTGPVPVPHSRETPAAAPDAGPPRKGEPSRRPPAPTSSLERSIPGGP
jgi:exosortase